MESVLIAIAWLMVVWSIGAFAVCKIIERHETSIVTSLRLYFGRAHTAEDWQAIKTWAILCWPGALVFLALDWLIRNTGP